MIIYGILSLSFRHSANFDLADLNPFTDRML